MCQCGLHDEAVEHERRQFDRAGESPRRLLGPTITHSRRPLHQLALLTETTLVGTLAVPAESMISCPVRSNTSMSAANCLGVSPADAVERARPGMMILRHFGIALNSVLEGEMAQTTEATVA